MVSAVHLFVGRPWQRRYGTAEIGSSSKVQQAFLHHLRGRSKMVLAEGTPNWAFSRQAFRGLPPQAASRLQTGGGRWAR